MVRSALIAGVLAIVVAVPARAQSRFELGVTGGWIFSEGVDGDPVATPNGTFTGITVKSGPALGVSFAVLNQSGGEIGFQWGRQWSKLGVKGIPSVEIGDLNIDQYHATFGYNAMPGAKVRPFLSIGLGATNYSSVSYSTPIQSGEIGGSLRFSMKIGVGIKSWGNDAVGFRASMNWVPTAIGSKDTGWFCDPFYGCFVTTQSTWSNQVEFGGGVVFRFGRLRRFTRVRSRLRSPSFGGQARRSRRSGLPLSRPAPARPTRARSAASRGTRATQSAPICRRR